MSLPLIWRWWWSFELLRIQCYLIWWVKETCAHLASPSLLDCYRYLSAPDCTQQIASPSVQNTSKINAVMQSFPHFSLYVLYERHQTQQHLTSQYRHICENCLCGNQDGSCSLCPGVFPFRVAACILGCYHFLYRFFRLVRTRNWTFKYNLRAFTLLCLWIRTLIKSACNYFNNSMVRFNSFKSTVRLWYGLLSMCPWFDSLQIVKK